MKTAKALLNPLGLILGLAFILRVWGVNFGLPYLYHADEPIVINHAMAYGSGDLNPHFFNIPPLTSYAAFAVFGVYFLCGKIAGVFSGTDDFAALFLTDPSSFYLLARVLLGVLPAVLSVYALSRVVKSFAASQTALLSALFLALNFTHARDAHYVYADMLLLLILICGFYPILRLSREEKASNYCLAGAFLGAAVAAKYNGVFLVIPLLTAHFLSSRHCLPCRQAGEETPERGRRGNLLYVLFDKRLIAAALISLAVYSILNPFTWLDARFFFAEMFEQSKAEGSVGVWHHFSYSAAGAMGWPMLILSAAGIVGGIRQAENQVLFSFVAVYFLVLSFFSQPYDRYVLPMLPFLSYFAALGILTVSEKRKLLGFVLIFLCAVTPLAKTVLCDLILVRQDTRTQALLWIEQNIPSGSKIALEDPFFMPRLKHSAAQLMEKKGEAEKAGNALQVKRIDLLLREQKALGYNLFFLADDTAGGFLFSRPRLPRKLEELKAAGIDYVLLPKIRENVQPEPEFYRVIRENGELLTRFTPYRDAEISWPLDQQPLTGAPFLWKELISRKRNGQIIEIYRIRPLGSASAKPHGGHAG